MNLEPLMNAPFPIKLHVATVVPAVVIGRWLIAVSQKGSRWHRQLGALYLALMTTTAIAVIFIHQTNPKGPFGFSFIHLFVQLTLIGVVNAIRAARRHDVKRHKYAMLGVFVGGILIAGTLAFMPGRIMYWMFTGG